jgi:hypothetical protein
MRIKHQSRRQFLFQTGFALSGLAAAPRLFTQKAGRAPLRGLMLDAARLPEPLDYYRRVIDFCADWQLNAIQVRIADDQGSAMRFSSVPDLLFHKHAFAPEQLHDLALYAKSRGVDLIPELESFGHTGFITRSPKYAHLLDDDPRLPSEFTGIIPVHPETLQLFTGLYREVAAVFPSIYLHGGCDEVNWGGSELSRKALHTKQRYEIWGDYLNSLGRVAQALGKQFIVWGDMVVHKEPRILDQIDKSIVVMDWDYVETNSAKLHETRAKIRDNGSRAIGAPALISYRCGPRAGINQLANIDAFADAYLTSGDPGSLGVILTNWVPSRYIQNSIWDGFAYAAIAFNQGTAAARQSAFRRFVEKHYGARWSSDWAEAFRLIYANAPEINRRKAPDETVPLEVPWSSDEQLAGVLAHPPLPNPFTRLHSLLVSLEERVGKNHADFQAVLLTIRYLEHLYWRDEVITKSPLSREDAASFIRNVADRDRTLADALSREWDTGRFPDSEAKSKPLFGFEPKDQLVFQFQQAADYSASLASHPDRFFQQLKKTRPA